MNLGASRNLADITAQCTCLAKLTQSAGAASAAANLTGPAAADRKKGSMSLHSGAERASNRAPWSPLAFSLEEDVEDRKHYVGHSVKHLHSLRRRAAAAAAPHRGMYSI
jgi:hypothetical protein